MGEWESLPNSQKFAHSPHQMFIRSPPKISSAPSPLPPPLPPHKIFKL